MRVGPLVRIAAAAAAAAAPPPSPLVPNQLCDFACTLVARRRHNHDHRRRRPAASLLALSALEATQLVELLSGRLRQESVPVKLKGLNLALTLVNAGSSSLVRALDRDGT